MAKVVQIIWVTNSDDTEQLGQYDWANNYDVISFFCFPTHANMADVFQSTIQK